MEVIIVGGGIGGLTTALALHGQGFQGRIRVFESVAEIRPLGVGINVQSHASRELTRLGLRDAMAAAGMETRERAYYTHNGQLIFSEPTGRFAGFDYSQFSIHRGELLMILLAAARERLGSENIICGHRCVGFQDDGDSATAHFVDVDGRPLPSVRGDLVIAADGIHSAIRRQLYPDEGEPRFHGINMWRGVTRAKPFLTGASTIQVGSLHRTGKMVIYPIRNGVDEEGNQLINWNVDAVTKERGAIDWGKTGRLEDFFHLVKDWHFDWLDPAELVRKAEFIFSFPMVDRDPVKRWAFNRVALLGDAAHPMYPRGGNGGAAAILDAVTIARLLADAGKDTKEVPAVLQAYEALRLPAANQVVLQTRTASPDTIIDVVETRTNGARFDDVNDVISRDEVLAITDGYKKVVSGDIIAR
jgi:2-polyprenyl-6-methoxyphenol hydroxylase-like FAD-dependent oxidoreductase